jgi:hypothetical protein
MNKTIKFILLVAGIGLLVYGIYTMIAPEASLSIGSLDIIAQDNTNSYITIGLGLAAIFISFIGSKSLK